MDAIIIGLLLLVILGLAGLLAFIVQKGIEEKKIWFEQMKDLSDKIYFSKSQDLITNRIVNDTPKEEPSKNKEEEGIPLENVPLEELAKAYGATVPEVK
jgi:hypothetical protein